MSESIFLDPVSRLTRDIRDAARILNPDEARFLVDAYYGMQGDRIRAENQLRALGESNEPNSVMSWLGDQRTVLEKQVARALDAYSGANQAGIWSRSITGIGPIIAAGLLAHIDINKAPTVGHIWRYAGLDPTSEWLGNERATKLIEAVIADEADESQILTSPIVARLRAALDLTPRAMKALVDGMVGHPIDLEALANVLNISLERITSLIETILTNEPELRRAPRGASEITPSVIAAIAKTVNIKAEIIMGRLFDPDTGKHSMTKAALVAVLAKRPWNASLKRLCYLIGESFVKVANLEDDVYGKVYIERKLYEGLKNDKGDYADQADESLSEKDYGEDTDARKWYEGRYPGGAFMHWTNLDVEARKAYPDDSEDMYPDESMGLHEDIRKEYLDGLRKLRSKRRADQAKSRTTYLTKIRADYLRNVAGNPGSGVKMLPPARIHRRACRYAVKLYLSHLHHVMYVQTFGKLPPKPYIIEHGGHTHFTAPPNWPMKDVSFFDVPQPQVETPPAPEESNRLALEAPKKKAAKKKAGKKHKRR